MAIGVSNADKPLVYVSRLSKVERSALYALDDAFPSLEVRSRFTGAIHDVQIDRLMLSMDDLKVAQHLLKNATTDADYRAVVNRSYYSIHHAIRVMVLRELNFEADAHEGAIKELKQLLKEATFRLGCGLDEGIIKEVAEARDNRSVADYSPYDFSRREGTTQWIPITGNTWKAAAEFNLNLAQRMQQAALKLLGLA